MIAAPVARPLLNRCGAASYPPFTCRRLKLGDPQPFEWWDEVAGRWCKGDTLPASLVALLPSAMRERVAAHRWRWLGMQAEMVHPCPRV